MWIWVFIASCVVLVGVHLVGARDGFPRALLIALALGGLVGGVIGYWLKMKGIVL